MIRPAIEQDREALRALTEKAEQNFTDPWHWYNSTSYIYEDEGRLCGGMTARPVAEIAMVLDREQSPLKRMRVANALLYPTLLQLGAMGYDQAHAPVAPQYAHLADALVKRGFILDTRIRTMFDLVKWR